VTQIITLWQPWASLIALDLKRYETRSWATNYRGKLAIHAAKRKATTNPLDHLLQKDWASLSDKERKGYLFCSEINKYEPKPFGVIVAIADLTDCLPMVDHVRGDEMWQKLLHPDRVISIAGQTELEQSVGYWRSGRYAWKLENICPIAEPIPVRGNQGLTAIQDEAVLRAIEKELAK
jgi:hypothetical protein